MSYLTVCLHECYPIRESKCMAWETGQKLLSMSGPRQKKHALNITGVLILTLLASLYLYDSCQECNIFKVVFHFKNDLHFFSQDMTHVMGKNRKELLAMAKGHIEDKKGWYYCLTSAFQVLICNVQF